MNNAFEILVFLTLFAPVGLIVALNYVMYAEPRYMRQPPAPMLPAATPPQPIAAAKVVNEFDFRQAA
jgi:hypothetical protein